MPKFPDVERLIDLELEKRGWFRKNLAKKLNISESWFSKLMSQEKLTVSQLLEIADVLNINPKSLIPDKKGTENPTTLEEYIWFSIKDKLDKYIDKKIEEKLKK